MGQGGRTGFGLASRRATRIGLRARQCFRLGVCSRGRGGDFFFFSRGGKRDHLAFSVFGARTFTRGRRQLRFRAGLRAGDRRAHLRRVRQRGRARNRTGARSSRPRAPSSSRSSLGRLTASDCVRPLRAAPVRLSWARACLLRSRSRQVGKTASGGGPSPIAVRWTAVGRPACAAAPGPARVSGRDITELAQRRRHQRARPLSWLDAAARSPSRPVSVFTRR